MTTKAVSRTRRSVLRSARLRARAQARTAGPRSRSATEAGAAPALGETLARLARVSTSLSVGFGVLAKTAHGERVAQKSAALAAAHRAIADEIAAVAVTLGVGVPRVRSTCGDRLRWEWLASSARLLDGAPDVRLLAECARLAREASDVAGAMPSDAAPGPQAALRQVVADLHRASAIAQRVVARPGLLQRSLALT